MLRTDAQETPNPNDLEAYIKEASDVKSLVHQAGWQILVRDLLKYQSGIASRIAYFNYKRPEFMEARILYLAIDKIFSLVNDYDENRERAIELLNKMENPSLSTIMDVDNEPPIKGESKDGY